MRPIRQIILIRRNRKENQQRNQLFQRVLFNLGKGVALTFSLVVVTAIFVGAYVFTQLTRDLPSLEQIPTFLNPENGLFLEPTQIFDKSGELLIASLDNPGISRRYLVIDPDQPEHFSTQFVRIMIASLQPNYWSSPGYSITEWNNPLPVTIAEKLVDGLLLETEPQSLNRSIRMRLLAGQLVSQYGRVQVLEWYLNSAYFGHLAYGADSASQLYLGKPAQNLSLTESILLTSVHMSPALNPIDAPYAALEYYEILAANLVKSGFISKSEYGEVVSTSLTFSPDLAVSRPAYPAFIELVLKQAATILGKQNIERGGLRIITTMDLDLQTQVECVLILQLQKLGNDHVSSASTAGLPCEAASLLSPLPSSILAEPADVLGSVVILNNSTGDILALVGDMDNTGKETSMQTHQAGSLLTPIASVALISRGISPATLVWDIPAKSDSDSQKEMDFNQYKGPMRLRTAINNDYNMPILQLVNSIGAFTVWKSTEPLGLTNISSTLPDAQIIMEGKSLNILEAAYIYTVFANLGNHFGMQPNNSSLVEAAAITRIETANKHILYAPAVPAKQSVLSEPIAYMIHNMLSDEMSRWKQYGHPNLMETGKPVGVKLGITKTGDEVWTVGYTKQYLVASWFGNQASSSSPVPLDYKISAGVWNALIQYTSQGETAEQWTVPAGVVQLDVCDPSGKLATNICPNVVNEVFLVGMEPTEYDSMYQNVEINLETGRLATVFTPLELRQEQLFFVVPEEAKTWAAAVDLPQPPVEYDTIRTPVENAELSITSPSMFAFIHGEIEINGTVSGSDFQSYSLQVGKGLNPSTWLEIGSGTKPVTDSVLGTWKTSQDGLYAMRLVKVGKDQQLETSIIQITVDNTPPVVTILYPPEASEISISNQQTVFFQIEVLENVQVEKIIWGMDGKQLAETGEEIRSFSWEPIKGKHLLQVTVEDSAGNRATAELEFIVTK